MFGGAGAGAKSADAPKANLFGGASAVAQLPKEGQVEPLKTTAAIASGGDDEKYK